ncbi:hypothetical protein Kpho02_29240 [Kitasatospora phosalacinea]|uniref:Uncharacterized protein n=1 Tax=Kitasatospora phosalacinea TaxID=2065 RepID=A0A9W6V322_9ACTN|nr:hypothetical protein Kpho02_29240 [Kitasatospora phosalacinea]
MSILRDLTCRPASGFRICPLGTATEPAPHHRHPARTPLTSCSGWRSLPLRVDVAPAPKEETPTPGVGKTPYSTLGAGSGKSR